MATKYSDFIHLQNFLPVYDILEESSNVWQSFIPTEQFNDLLRKSIADITSTEPSKRKSIWISGTFGTGKSHASAVIKHLLCDNIESIDSYIDNIKDASLKCQLKNLRKGKRYFSVTLKGVENAYDIPRFKLSLQKAVSQAIKKVEPSFVVNSDFQVAIDWIDKHREVFEKYVLHVDNDLKDFVDTTDQVIQRLKESNINMCQTVQKAIFNQFGTMLEQQSISEWLVEVDKKLEEMKIADGLIIFWDEFTSVMDTLKSDRINVLQNIAEKSQNNNLFLFLISHRIETQSQNNRGKDISRMRDRFDEIGYSMDSLSTYLIMRHSYTIPDEESNYQFKSLVNSKSSIFEELLNFLTNKNAEEKDQIKKLFPIHPYTAYLCSTISDFIGSSNRSVIKFMHDDISGFDAFLNDENNFNSDKLLTADALWDFFYEDFNNDQNCTSFIRTFTTYKNKVIAQGDDYVRVFKSILLLNALSPKFKSDIDLLTPEEKVLKYIYLGDRVSKKLTDILNYLDENKIVPRNILGLFKITGTTYNDTEMNQQRDIERSIYKSSVDIINYNTNSKVELLQYFEIGKYLRRETEAKIFSCNEQESLIHSCLNKLTDHKPNYLHVAIFLSITEEERDSKLQLLKNFSKEYDDLIIVIPEETFSMPNYQKFIESVTTIEVAKSHFNDTVCKDNENIARRLVEKWVKQLLDNTYIVFFNGELYREGTVKQLPELINNKLAKFAYPKGFESVKFVAPSTFFTESNRIHVILQILQAENRDQIITHKRDAPPIKYIFEENGNTLITNSGNLSENALNGNSWIVEVCREMDKCIENAKKNYQDKFSLPDILSSFISKPFGMFPSFANCAAITYALKKHKANLFDTKISQPISNDDLAKMVHEMFEMWKEGKSEYNNKLILRFGSLEEKLLTELFIDIFDLRETEGININNIKSLENVIWNIQEFFIDLKAKYPLWTLLYLPNISDNIKKAIEEIISFFDSKNPSVDNIKILYKLINNNKIDLNLTLTKIDNYIKGFNYYVENEIDEAPIKKEWWNEMLASVYKLNDIAYLKESEVRQKIVKFYIEKTRRQNEGSALGETSETTNNGVTEPSIDETLNKAKEKAQEKVKEMNMPNIMWQKMILKLIDKYPEITNFFN